MRVPDRLRICSKLLLLAMGLTVALHSSGARAAARGRAERASEQLGPVEYVNPFIGTAASRKLPSLPIYVPPWGFPLGTIWIPEGLGRVPIELVTAQVSGRRF
jgi:hypothetical protein